MFANATRQTIQEKFNEVVPFLEQYMPGVIQRLNSCSVEEKIIMKFLYASMPISDIADYNFDTYLGFAAHALLLKRNISWCTDMPDDIFLNYILFYRINNEDIEDCRKLFYDSLHERIVGKSMIDTVLEVNYWCAENVVYRSTDMRTASPLTVWRTGSGRCGEESTFTVTAMRSVGIPARQVYTPRWSHCDDNHAWVEVWCDGKWHYLGACEPEPVLDRGWFTEAASRAMFIHSRVFSPVIADGEIVGRQGKAVVLNLLDRYADFRQFTVKVSDEHGQPVKGAVVQFEVLNQSEFYPVASKITDENGNAEITLGLADIHIHVRRGEQFVECFADTAQINHIDIWLGGAAIHGSCTEDFKITVSEGDNSRRIELTAEQNMQRNQKIAHADKIREEKISGFYREQEANEAVEKYSCKEELKAVLHKSKGNFAEVVNYLNAAADNDNPDMRIKLLMSLSDKDFCDMKSDILMEHFKKALPFSGKYAEEIFVEYVMCPRIYFEKITPYREFISGYFDEKTKECFQNNPRLVWKYVSANVISKEDQEYPELFTSPCGTLQVKCGSVISKRILFTAICRTIGIAARINPATMFAEYYQSGKFVPVEREAECNAKLVIRSLDGTQWLYMQNWSLGVLENGSYRTLNLTGAVWQNGCLPVDVPRGYYRLFVTNRMPNGNLLARKYCFACGKNETAEVSIALPEAQVADLLENVPFSAFKVTDEYGKVYTAKELAG